MKAALQAEYFFYSIFFRMFHHKYHINIDEIQYTHQ